MKYASLALMLLTVINHTALAANTGKIAEREVPLPAGASEQLRRAIADSPVPDTAREQKLPTNKPEWLLAREQEAQFENARIARWPNTLKVQIAKQKINGVAVSHLTPATLAEENKNRLFIHLHGGAYVFGGGDAGLGEGLLIANRLNIPVISIDYRMPPNYPFPAAVDDVVAVYKHLLERYKPKTMVIGGSSAGGGLALASVHQIRQMGLPAPAAVYAGTAWADLSKTGDTLYTLEGIDRGLMSYDGLLEAAAKLYAAEHNVKNPLISPVYGDFKGFPPTILITGTRDLFLSDTVRTHRNLRTLGVDADLHVYEGMSHGEYLYAIDSPESLDVFKELEKFVRKHLRQGEHR